MNPTNPRYKKIRNLVLEQLSQKNGVEKAAELLNKNGFTAPCGKSVHKKIKNNGSISDFLREAINEKIRRDKL
jgi:hypothetical protein